MGKDQFELPVFACERETGRMFLLTSIEAVRAYADEFLDIIDDDFDFWDANGHRLRMTEDFASDRVSSPVIARSDVCGLLWNVESFGQSPEADPEVMKQIENALRRKGYR